VNVLYKYRGWLLGALTVAMLVLPGAGLTDEWVCSALPLAATIFVVFVFVRIVARRTIGEHTRGVVHDADRLVTEGIYSRIRHPLYLSNAGIGYSFVILHFGFQLVAIAFVVVLFSFEFLLSRLEDRFLEDRFGDDWREWAAVTPAFFPRLINRGFAVGGSAGRGAKTPMKSRSFFASFRADTSTWFWLVFAIAVIVARKFVG